MPTKFSNGGDFGGQRVRNVATPTASTDAATKGYADLANTETLVWTGAAYPAKSKAYAIYQGPTDPATVGVTLVDGDIWIDTDAVSPVSLKSVVTLASDVTNSNATANTIADVTGLSFPVLAGVRYAFRFVIFYTAAATTTGSRWSINGPAITSLYYNSQWSQTASSRQITEGLSTYDQPTGANASSASTGSNMAVIEGHIMPSASGNVVARFSSEVASSAIVAKAGSYIEVTRLT